MRRLWTQFFALLLVLPSFTRTLALAQVPIGSGETLSGFIPSGEQGDYTFEGEAGDTIILQATRTSGTLCPGLRLYDPDNNLETSATNPSCSLTNLLHDYKLLSSGTYTVVVYDGWLEGGYGDYNISFLKIPGALSSPEDSDGGVLVSGATKTGRIFPAGDTDAFSFSGSAGDAIVLQATRTSDSLCPGLLLYDPNGDLETHLPNGSCNLSELLYDYKLLSSGTYTVVVYDGWLEGGYGDYNISFLKIPGALYSTKDSDGGVLVSGQTKTGRIFPAGDTDAFSFSGSAGDAIILQATRTSDSLCPGFLLYDPNGDLETYLPNGSCNISELLYDYRLLRSGAYTLVIYDGLKQDRYGNYTLSFLKIPGALYCTMDPNGGALVSNSTVTGSISPKGDLDGFIFAGCAGETVSIQVRRSSGNLCAGFRLYDSNGDLETSATNPSCSLTNLLSDHELLLSGTYTVLVYDGWEDGRYGNYTMSFVKIPSNPSCCNRDADGYASVACDGTDCNDRDPIMHPGVVEQCQNGTDDNCNDLSDHEDPDCQCLDNDDDGYGNPSNPNCTYSGLDCNDYRVDVNPGMTDICDDGIDNNCDGFVDNCLGSCAASVEASTYPVRSVIGPSDLAKHLGWLLLPAGAIIGRTIWRRKR